MLIALDGRRSIAGIAAAIDDQAQDG